MLTTDDMPRYNGGRWESVKCDKLPAGVTMQVIVEHDDDMREPWKEHDGHGPITDWTRRDKKPGERVLAQDRGARRLYDFAAAVRKARAEGWDAPPYGGTSGERAARAAESDFQRLRAWCNSEWHWIVLGVRLLDSDGEELAREYLGGIESDGDHWREQAAEIGQQLLDDHATEQAQRAEWAARGVVTRP